jgi:beta-fructofuranosidase
MGKCGLILDGDEDGNGYFISLDFVYGLIQIRSWGFNETDNHKNFIFENLQTNQFNTSQEHKLDFKLIRYGHYIEFAVNEVVKLTLIDYRYQGSLIGIYSSSSVISLTNSLLYSISEPESEYGAQESQVQKMQESRTTLK